MEVAGSRITCSGYHSVKVVRIQCIRVYWEAYISLLVAVLLYAIRLVRLVRYNCTYSARVFHIGNRVGSSGGISCYT